jgi:hypothetical protein
LSVGEAEETAPKDDHKLPAAVEMGRKGGAARAAKMDPSRRAEIARGAARTRWRRARQKQIEFSLSPNLALTFCS